MGGSFTLATPGAGHPGPYHHNEPLRGTLAFSCSAIRMRDQNRQGYGLSCENRVTKPSGLFTGRYCWRPLDEQNRTRVAVRPPRRRFRGAWTREHNHWHVCTRKSTSRFAVMVANNAAGDSGTRWLVLAGCDVCLPKEAIPGSVYHIRGGSTVVLPGVIHFIGGFLLGQFPRTVYGPFLEKLAEQTQMAVIATPFHSPAVASAKTLASGKASAFLENTNNYPILDTSLFFDHAQLARMLHERFRDASSALSRLLASPERLPVYGMGHSLGAKLLALMYSEPVEERVTEKRAIRPPRANIFLAYNNYSTKQSIPLFDDAMKAVDAVAGSTGWRMVEGFFRDAMALGGVASSSQSRRERGPFRDLRPSIENKGSSASDGSDIWSEWAAMVSGAARALNEREFTPSPEEAQRRIEYYYCCERNLIIKFAQDPIDQSDALAAALWYRFSQGERAFDFRQLPGGHLVPVSASYRRMFPFDVDAAGFGNGSGSRSRRQHNDSQTGDGMRGRPRSEQQNPDQVTALTEAISNYLRRSL